MRLRQSASHSPMRERGRFWPPFLATGALITFFVAGAFVYTHVGAPLFARIHGHAAPPLLVVALAIVGGAASFFSPCSLAITPSFIMAFAADPDRPLSRAVLLRAGALVALGIVGFYALAGTLVIAVGASVYAILIYLVPIVGAVFIGLGVIIAMGRSDLGIFARLTAANPWHRFYEDKLHERGHLRAPALVGFGTAYGAASHTCTLPIFLGIVLLPLGLGEPFLAGLAVLLYGTAIALLILIMIPCGQELVLAIRRRAGFYLQYATGWLFIFTGIYLLRYFATNFGGRWL